MTDAINAVSVVVNLTLSPEPEIYVGTFDEPFSFTVGAAQHLRVLRAKQLVAAYAPGHWRNVRVVEGDPPKANVASGTELPPSPPIDPPKKDAW